MAKYLKHHEGIEVSHVFVADLWREHGLTPHRQDTFTLSKGPLFAPEGSFMKIVAAKYAGRELHVVVDNLGTYVTPEVRD